MKKLLILLLLCTGVHICSAAAYGSNAVKITSPAGLAKVLEQLKEKFKDSPNSENFLNELDTLIVQANTAPTDKIEPDLQAALKKLHANVHTIYTNADQGKLLFDDHKNIIGEFSARGALMQIADGIDPFAQTTSSPERDHARSTSPSAAQSNASTSPVNDITRQFFNAFGAGPDAVAQLKKIFNVNNPAKFWYATANLPAPMNLTNMSALSMATISRADDKLKLMLDNNFPLTLDSRNESALHIAASRRDATKLKMLLDKFLPVANLETSALDPRAQKNASQKTPYEIFIEKTQSNRTQEEQNIIDRLNFRLSQ